MGPKKVARPARIPISISASFRDRLVLDIGRGFGLTGLNRLHIWDHAQLFKFLAYDQGSLCLGCPILTLRQIVERAEFVFPQIDDDLRHVHLTFDEKIKEPLQRFFYQVGVKKFSGLSDENSMEIHKS